MSDASNRWLTFQLAEYTFAVNIGMVRELLSEKDLTITRPPQAEHGIGGVARVRDDVVPVVDLRPLLGFRSMHEETNEIVQMLSDREQDHINWLTELESSVKEERPFTLQVNPNLCAFGKWYNSLIGNQSRLNEFTNGDLTLTEVIERFNQPHQRIHRIAQRVTDLVEKGDVKQAMSIIEECHDTDLKLMIDLFGRCRQLYATLRQGVLMICDWHGHHLGALVDSVDEVVIFKPDEMHDIAGLTNGNGFVDGVANLAGRDQLLQVLSIEAIFRRFVPHAAEETRQSEPELAAV